MAPVIAFPAPGRDRQRAATWPPTIRRVAAMSPITKDNLHPVTEESLSPPPSPRLKPILPLDMEASDLDLNDNPSSHFLSPMYDYEDRASDSDGGEDFEWDAGITDFSLFDDDRLQAEERNEALPSRWEHFMSSQTDALQRTKQRSQSLDTTRPPLPMSVDEELEMPGLTPDGSPNLGDDLEEEESDSPNSSSLPMPIPTPKYLTIEVSPSSPTDRSISEDEDLPLSFFYRRPKQSPQQAKKKLHRPGLSHRRTLSGKLHAWRSPSWHIHSVHEDVEAEMEAELLAERGQDVRGRR